MIVVDTNVLVAFAIPGPRKKAAAALASNDPDWSSPQLWRSEFRNVLSGYIRRGHATLEDALEMEREAQSRLDDVDYRPDSRLVLELAQASGCTAYDCEFVALAKELRIPLVTLDKDVLKAFPDIAVPLPEAG